MNLAILIVVLSVLALVALFTLARGQLYGRAAPGQDTHQLQAIDVEAFRNLVDEGEQQFLRQNLEPAEFREVQRQRTLAAIDYVRGAAKNARILIAVGEAARQSADPAIASAAEKLFENAVELRLYAIQAIPRLYLRVLMPGMSDSARRLVDNYDNLAHQAVVLSCLSGPAVRAGMTT
jgi:hypothetical protein